MLECSLLARALAVVELIFPFGGFDQILKFPLPTWQVGWFSPFLLACYDPEREEYQSVCRVMSGFTDVFYKEVRGRSSLGAPSCLHGYILGGDSAA
jgi:hypothetical protein